MTIDVDPDGSGTVSVDVLADREAMTLIGDPSSAIRLDDLTTAGWKIEPPDIDPDDGGMTVSGTREFGSGRELADVLAGLGVGGTDDEADGGDPGFGVPFIDDVVLGVANSSSGAEYEFDAVVHIPGGLDSISDPALTEVLGGLPVGRTPEELIEMGYEPSKGLGDLTIRVRLPGTVDQTTMEVNGDFVEWSGQVGSDSDIDAVLSVKSATADRRPAMIRLVGLGVGVAALILLIVGIVRRR